jgi:septum site-determining protein MinD
LPYNVFHINTFVTGADPAVEKVIFNNMKISIGETMVDVQGLSISKHWDNEKGRMTLLARNGGASLEEATVEDSYPDTIAGMLCFAKSGGIVPTATASSGTITWKISGLKPDEVRELVYTALPPSVLNDPAARKLPTEKDRALLETSKDMPPRLILGASVQRPAEIPTQPEPAPEQVSLPEPRKPGEKMATVIAIGAGKGGTGKTTFSINLAVALAELGFETVLLDADASMSNLAPYMGIDVQSMKATLHEVLAGEAEPEKAVYRALDEHLRIVPSGLSIGGFLKMDRGLLAEVIEHFSEGADFIVIDTPAGYNKEVALSLKASDDLLLVLNPDEGSLIDGLKVQETARILGVNVRGIVLNRYDMKGQKYGKAQIETHFGTPVIAMLPEDADMRRKDRVPLVMARPGSKTAHEIMKVARIVSGRTDATAPVTRTFSARLMEALFRA